MLAAGRHIVCFALLIAMAGHSWSQEPSPSPGETTNQNQTPRNENQTKSDTDQHGTEQSPYFIKIIGAEPNATDWWMFWATVAATQHFGRFRSEAAKTEDATEAPKSKDEPRTCGYIDWNSSGVITFHVLDRLFGGGFTRST